MSFLRRVLGGGGEKAPEWASFMKADEYREFEALVLADMTARGYTLELTGDGGLVAEGGPNPGTYGLFNVAQVFHASDRSSWPDVIRTHFAHIAMSTPDIDPIDIESALPLLKVRLNRVADTPPELLADMVKTEVAPDLVAALVLDLPTTVRGTAEDDLDHWATPIDELYRAAAANMADEVRTYDRTTVPIRDGHTFEAWESDSFFVSSQAYRFQEIVGDLTNGALVAMPNRHQLAWHVIETAAGTIAAVQALIQVANVGYDEGPGSLTPDLYWWRDGTFTLLPAILNKKGVQFVPPDEFVQVLNSLA